MGVLASDSTDDPKQPKQSDRQDSPLSRILSEQQRRAINKYWDEQAQVKITFPPMVEGQDAWRVSNAMAFITPEQKPTPDTRARYQRLMHRVLLSLSDRVKDFGAWLYAKARRWAPERERQDSMAGPSVAGAPGIDLGNPPYDPLCWWCRSGYAHSHGSGPGLKRFHCTECGQGFGVNDYESNTVTCPKCGNDGIGSIIDSLEGGG